LQGQSLEVLGWNHRNDSLHLTLVLPDGTRSFIPAHWTDLDIADIQNRQSKNRRPTKKVLGSICHLLHARKIVDALLCKIDPSKEENNRASTTEPLAPPAQSTSDAGHMAKPQPTTASKAHRSIGQAYSQSGVSTKSQPSSGEKA
jgi:hypothetical protein